MALTTTNSGAVLVGRPASAEAGMKVMKVKVLRPFYFNRVVQKKDAVVELPEIFARECISAKKADVCEEAPAVSAKPAEALPSAKESAKGKDEKK